MDSWWQYLSFNWSRENLFLPFWQEIPVLIGLVLIFLVEIAISGWKNSSLGKFTSFKRNNYWDIFSALLYLSGVRRIVLNVLLLGFLGYYYRNYYFEGKFLYALEVSKDWPLWTKFLAVTFTYDILFYLSHRLKHENNMLWNLHEFHHSSTRVSLLTPYRSQPLDSLVHLLTISIPIQFLFDLSLLNSLFFLLITSLMGLLNHARIDSDFGLLGKYIFVSPRMHHEHHSKENLKFNYGEIFVFWDKLFGTYKAPVKSIFEINQGLENNFYEYEPPIKAFIKPIGRFYKSLFSLHWK